MNLRFASLTIVALALSSASFADSKLTGYHRYPQFRGLSGLPGGGFGVNRYGQPDFRGAMAYSTPVAYGLKDWRVVVGGSFVSKNGTFSFSENTNTSNDTGNGTGQFLVGVPIDKFGELTVGYMVLSTEGDGAFNFQWSPPNQKGDVHFAVGVQDLRGNGGASGTNVKGDLDNSTSFYGVGTWQANEKTFLSLGAGTKRFGGVFGSASYQLHTNVKAFAEYDHFNWNFGLAFNPFSRQLKEETWYSNEKRTELTMQVGVVAGRHAYWALNFSF